MSKQLNRMRIMNGLPPKKEKVVESKVEEKPQLPELKSEFQEADPSGQNPPYFWHNYGGKIIWRAVALDPETYIPRKGILTRYGKKLLEEGAKYYSTVKFSDFERELEVIDKADVDPMKCEWLKENSPLSYQEWTRLRSTYKGSQPS